MAAQGSADPPAFRYRADTAFVLDGIYFLEAFLWDPSKVFENQSATAMSQFHETAEELKKKSEELEKKLLAVRDSKAPGDDILGDIKSASEILDRLNRLIGHSEAAEDLRTQLEDTKKRFPLMLLSVTAEDYVGELVTKAELLWEWVQLYIQHDTTEGASDSSKTDATTGVTTGAKEHAGRSKTPNRTRETLRGGTHASSESDHVLLGMDFLNAYSVSGEWSEEGWGEKERVSFGRGEKRTAVASLEVEFKRAKAQKVAERQTLLPHPPDESVPERSYSAKLPSEEEGYYRVPVFYATDRKEAYSGSLRPEYGSSRKSWSARARTDCLNYGVADVSIPFSRARGTIPTPGSFPIWRRPKAKDHVLILSTTRINGAEEFDEMLKATARETASLPKGDAQLAHSVLVYVHGYNNTFEDALRRAAQLKWDLQFRGPVAVYSWPSAQVARCYPVDEATIDWASPHFQLFLKQLLTVQADLQGEFDKDPVKRGHVAQVHVLAHSMGNRLVMQAMDSLVRAKEFGGALPAALGHVIAAAPDVDAEYFHHVAAALSTQREAAAQIQAAQPSAAAPVRAITLYASEHDAALKLSWDLHAYPRAGRSSTNYMVVDGLFDTVIAPHASRMARHVNFDFGYGHSEAFEKEAMLDDIMKALLRTQNDKRLRPFFKDLSSVCPFEGPYYTFKEP